MSVIYKKPFSPNILGERLITACNNENYLEIEQLLQQGASPNYYGNESLIIAIDKKDENMVRLLVRYAKLNIPDDSVFNLIKDSNYDESIIRILLDHGAKFENGNYSVLTSCGFTLFKKFVILGADINFYIKGKPLSFYLLDEYSSDTLVKHFKLMFEHGLRTEDIDKNGDTLLLFFVRKKNRNLNILKLILDSGANINATNNNGLNVFDLAEDPEYIRYIAKKFNITLPKLGNYSEWYDDWNKNRKLNNEKNNEALYELLKFQKGTKSNIPKNIRERLKNKKVLEEFENEPEYQVAKNENIMKKIQSFLNEMGKRPKRSKRSKKSKKFTKKIKQ